MKSKRLTVFSRLFICLLLVCTSICFTSCKQAEKQDLTFSKNSGFYENEITLKLASKKGATIYYTTDGTVPTTKSATYKKPIKIADRSQEPTVLSAEKTFPLRAILYRKSR